jgi:hypothetical protein
MSLLEKFCPILYLHSKEKYFPCSADWLLHKSDLIVNTTSPPTIIKQPTQKDLVDHNAGGNIVSFPEEVYPGQRPLSDVPIYGIQRERDDKTYLTYIFLYAYNGPYNVFNLLEAGQHTGDLEHLTLELDGKTQTLLRAMYSAHTTRDGRWVDAKDVPFENGRPVAYVALNGHGVYPMVGTVLRYFGVINDYTEKALLWDPKLIEVFPPSSPKYNPETMGWTTFWGWFGQCSGLPYKNWYGPDAKNIDIPDPHQLKTPFIFNPIWKYIGDYLFGLLLIILVYFLMLSIISHASTSFRCGHIGPALHCFNIAILAIIYSCIQFGLVTLIFLVLFLIGVYLI